MLIAVLFIMSAFLVARNVREKSQPEAATDIICPMYSRVDPGLSKTDDNGDHYWAYGGGFGDEINDRQFCINGLMFPDRTPHPSMAEVKYAQQFYQFTLADSDGLAISVTSEYLFIRSDSETLCWSLQEGNEVIASGKLQLDLDPCSTRVFKLTDNLPKLTSHGKPECQVDEHIIQVKMSEYLV